jgi:hypothetical protein
MEVDRNRSKGNERKGVEAFKKAVGNRQQAIVDKRFFCCLHFE